MRRADRLFQIVQLLRRDRAVTAAHLATELSVSERTIYRDVQDLVGSGVPIQGEAGVGYALPARFDLPPMMFDGEEIQALVLGARMVGSWSDEQLARAARSALAKIENVLPARLASSVTRNRLYVPDFHVPRQSLEVMASLRAALDQKRVLRLQYEDDKGAATVRTVRPLALWFWGRIWTLTAWCELRQDFRNFRLERMRRCEVLEQGFQDEPGRTVEDFLARMQAERTERPPQDLPAPPPKTPPRKTPRLDLLPAERRAVQRARLQLADLAALADEELFRRTDGAIGRERCAELTSLAAFQRLGSVGLETARDLLLLGLRRPADLGGRDPNQLYARLCEVTGVRHDPCVEDALRCAVAQVEHPDLPERWHAWHRWTPLRGKPAGTLPPELAALRRR